VRSRFPVPSLQDCLQRNQMHDRHHTASRRAPESSWCVAKTSAHDLLSPGPLGAASALPGLPACCALPQPACLRAAASSLPRACDGGSDKLNKTPFRARQALEDTGRLLACGSLSNRHWGLQHSVRRVLAHSAASK
jgi:hypothetical protein